MTIEDFDRHDMESISLAVAGFQEREQEREQGAWVRTRWQTWLYLNTQYKKPLQNPKNLVLFPWEKNITSLPKLDPKKEAELNELFDKVAKKAFANG